MTNENEKEIYSYGRFEMTNDGIIRDKLGEIPPIKPKFSRNDDSQTADSITLLNFLNENILDPSELEPKEEAVIEEPSKMHVIMDDISSDMFKEAAEIIHFADNGYVFIVFGMGSVKLDISNSQNILEITRDYVEIFNAENGEITMIKIDEVTGFVFEPAQKFEEEDTDEDD